MPSRECRSESRLQANDVLTKLPHMRHEQRPQGDNRHKHHSMHIYLEVSGRMPADKNPRSRPAAKARIPNPASLARLTVLAPRNTIDDMTLEPQEIVLVTL